MNNSDLLRAHTLDQRRRGLLESTITARRRILRHFAAYMGTRGLLAATADDIEGWLSTRRTSAGSRAGYLSHLRTFYTWAIAAGHADKDPTLTIPRPRVRAGLPRPINDSDLALALELCGGQLRVILTCGSFQGMRCIEISRLTREDILDDRDPPVLLARGKGDKPRVIPLHPLTWKALSFLPMSRSGPVLHDDYGQPYPAWKISHLGNDFLHGIGIEATMHQLRHWFGTGLYRTSGRDLLLVRDLMGHANVDTTKIYAAFDQAGAAPAVNALELRPSAPRDLLVRGPTMPGVGVTALRGARSTGALSPAAPGSTEGSDPPHPGT